MNSESSKPTNVGSNDELGLLERLRMRMLVQHGGPRGMDYGWNLQEHDSELHRDAAAEIERLRGEQEIRAMLPAEDALKRAYYYTELGGWRGPEADEFERWHSVAKVAANENEPLLRDALQALTHYREQTRPIADCDAVIARLRTRLGA